MKKIKRFNMTIYITEDYDEMSKKAAHIVASLLNEKQNPILGLATGETMLGMYKELILMNQGGQIDFSQATTFNLDEYYPISKENKQSYYHFMKTKLFNHININMDNTHIPNGLAKDIEIECKTFEQQTRATGGFDMQILGIGSNGHIGFNEPAEEFSQVTHKAELTQRTIKDNSRFFHSIDEMPSQAITIGIGTIMNSKRIMLMANGERKAQAIKETILGQVRPKAPASILQFHPNVTFVLDEAAASKLFK